MVSQEKANPTSAGAIHGQIYFISSFHKRVKTVCKNMQSMFQKEHLFLLQYDLVCDDSILLSIAQSCFWVGMLAALLVGGVLSDKFGRRNVWYGSGIVILVATWSMIFPKSFVVFIVCRIFIGIGSGTYLPNHPCINLSCATPPPPHMSFKNPDFRIFSFISTLCKYPNNSSQKNYCPANNS